MVAPYMFQSPESITDETLTQEADYASIRPILDYADALSQIREIPVQGPGGAIYLSQAEKRGNLMNRLASGVGSALGNVQTRRDLSLDQARRAQRSARAQSEQEILARKTMEATRMGEAIAASAVNMVDIMGLADAGAREAHNKGLHELEQDRVAGVRAERASRAEEIRGRRLKSLQTEYAMPTGLSLDDYIAAGGDLNLAQELGDMLRTRGQEQQIQQGMSGIQLQELPDEPWLNPVTGEPLMVDDRDENGERIQRPMTNFEAAREYYNENKRPRTQQFEVGDEEARYLMEGGDPSWFEQPEPQGRSSWDMDPRTGQLEIEDEEALRLLRGDPYVSPLREIEPMSEGAILESALEQAVGEEAVQRLQSANIASAGGLSGRTLEDVLASEYEARNLREQLGKLGIGMPTTREGFRPTQRMYYRGRQLPVQRALELAAKDFERQMASEGGFSDGFLDPRLKVR